MNQTGALVAVVGLFLLLGGLASPATQTHTSVTCIDSQYDPADGCVETTYQTPNFARGGLITLGLVLGIGGLIFALNDDSPSSSRAPSTSGSTARDADSGTAGQPIPLHERVQEQRETEDKD